MFRIGEVDLVLYDLFERMGGNTDALADSQVFPEREPRQAVFQLAAAQVGPALLQIEDGRTRIAHAQRRIGVVDVLDLGGPVLIFVYLVDIERLATLPIELSGQLHERMRREIEVVGRHVKRGRRIFVQLDVLQYEGRFADAPRSEDSHKAALPQNLVVNVAHIFGRRVLKPRPEGSYQSIHTYLLCPFCTKITKLHDV